MRTLTIALCSLIAAWMIVPATAQILRRRAYVEPAACQGGNCGPQAALQAPIFVPQAVITVETLTVPPRAPVIALVKEPQAVPVGPFTPVYYPGMRVRYKADSHGLFGAGTGTVMSVNPYYTDELRYQVRSDLPEVPLLLFVAAELESAPRSQSVAKPMPVGDGPTVVYAPAPAYAAPVLFGSRRTPLRSFVRRLLGR